MKKKKKLLTTNELALIVQDTSCVKRLSANQTHFEAVSAGIAVKKRL